MFCKNCGKEIKEKNEFCTECGNQIGVTLTNEHHTNKKQINYDDERWWVRFLRVVYIILYIPLPFIIWTVWEETSSSYNYYSNLSTNTSGKGFLYSLLTFGIYIIVLRLIKVAVRYIVIGRKPEWEKEFSKFY